MSHGGNVCSYFYFFCLSASPAFPWGPEGHGLAHYINLDLIQNLPAARDHIIAIQLHQEKGLDKNIPPGS